MGWRWLWRVLFGLAIGVATAFLGIQGAKQDPVKPPPQGATSAQRNQYEQRTQDRDRRNRFVLAAGLVCGLASFREVVGGLNEKLGEDRSERFRREIENELGTLWRNAADKEGVKAIESLGLHVWLVPRWHWRFAPAAFKERLPESWKLKIPAPAMWRPGKTSPCRSPSPFWHQMATRTRRARPLLAGAMASSTRCSAGLGAVSQCHEASVEADAS